ncbi:MAG: hypothetical protein MI976_22050 [Pseudomonadales bacterium]|nr:hypothetical protein [Pseudomonadales bacterium]
MSKNVIYRSQTELNELKNAVSSSYSRSPQHGHLDDLIIDDGIDDRPSPFSKGSSHSDDKLSMIEKLKSEIAHLETWLAHQKDGRSHSSISVASTIRALIATRKALLQSLEQV